jgi:hypothetical protein
LNTQHRLLSFLLAFFSISISIFALALPYGLNVNGTLEEYLVMGASIFEPQREILSHDSQITLRPLSFPIAVLSYSLTPYSYFGANIFNYGLIVLKGLILFYLLLRLQYPRVIALSMAILFAIYPTNATSLRLSIVVQLTTVSFLLALLFLLRLTSKWRILDLMLMGIFLALSMLIYEMAYVLILFVPPLLIAIKKFNKRIMGLSLIWYSIAGLVIIRWLYFYLTIKDSYQSSVVVQNNNLFSLFSELIKAYQWTLIGVWYRAFVYLYHARLTYIFIAAIVSSILFVMLLKLSSKDLPKLNNSALVPLLLALLLIGLGCAVFLITSVRDSYERIFGLSAIGAAVFLICVLQGLSRFFARYQDFVFSFAVSGLIFLSLIVGMSLREQELIVAFQQQVVVAEIVEEVPDLRGSAPTFVVFDETGSLVNTLYLRRIIEIPLQLLYDDAGIKGFLCYPNQTYGWEVQSCTLEQDYILYDANNIQYISPYDQLIAFVYRENGSLELLSEIPAEFLNGKSLDSYEPTSLICSTCSYPSQTYAYFTRFPFESPLQTTPRLEDLIAFFRN